MRLLGFPVCSHLSPFLQSLPLQKSIKMTESQWPLQIPSRSRVLCTGASRHQLMLKHSQCTLGDWARSHASSFRSVIAVKIQSLQQSVMSCLSSHWSCSVLLGFSVCFFFWLNSPLSPSVFQGHSHLAVITAHTVYSTILDIGQHNSSGFPGVSDGKESVCNAGDLCSIPGSGRSPGGGHGNPLQYFCLENHLDRAAWRATGP